MKKLGIFLISMLILLPEVMSISPIQIIKTEINISIDGDTLWIIGEGTDNIYFRNISIVNGSVSPFNDTYLIAFARERGEDVSEEEFLNSLKMCGTSLNFTKKWEDCIKLLGEQNTKVLECEEDKKYKSNYTQCIDDLNSERISSNNELNSKDNQINKLKQDIRSANNQRWWFGFGAIVVTSIFWAWRGGYFNKFAKNYAGSQHPQSGRV